MRTLTYKLWRWLVKRYHKTNNLWWTACTYCGEEFGSHEDHYDTAPLMPKGIRFGPYCGKSKCRKAGRKEYIARAKEYLTQQGTWDMNINLVLTETWPFQEYTKE